MRFRGGGRDGRESRREKLRRQCRALAYVGLAILAVVTLVVVTLALRR
jgi:hypothetical protein